MQNKRFQSPFFRYLPNAITCSRLVGAFCLLLTKPLTKWFFVLYTFCGVSDLLDGWLARATKNESSFGAMLDSISDLAFYAIMTLTTLPTLIERLPIGIWIAVGGIVVLRIFSYGFCALRKHSFASLHTYLNKLTGFAVFTIPFYIKLSCSTVLATVGCTISALATIEELYIHLVMKRPVKSIFQKSVPET